MTLLYIYCTGLVSWLGINWELTSILKYQKLDADLFFNGNYFYLGKVLVPYYCKFEAKKVYIHHTHQYFFNNTTPLSSPSFSSSSVFNFTLAKLWKVVRLPFLSGLLILALGEMIFEDFGGSCSSVSTGVLLFGEDTVKVEVWVSSTFCCSWEKSARACMALLKVSWW